MTIQNTKQYDFTALAVQDMASKKQINCIKALLYKICGKHEIIQRCANSYANVDYVMDEILTRFIPNYSGSLYNHVIHKEEASKIITILKYKLENK